jgi:hypothetical protein
MKNIFTLLLFVFGIVSGKTQTQFWSDTFEDAGSPSAGTRTPSIEYGSVSAPFAAYFKRTDGSDLSLMEAYSNVQGSKFWAGENLDYNNGVENNQSFIQTITWSNINISGKSGLSFRGLFAAFNSSPASVSSTNWEGRGTFPTNFDFLEVEYSIDGNPYTKIIGIYCNGVSNGALMLDTNDDGYGDANLLTKAFQEFTASIPGTGTTLSIRFRASANNAATEEFAIDNFRLFEVANTTSTWNGSTWSNGTPSSTTDAVIASNTAPSSFTCKALTINSGVALTTTGITATVNGNITNNGNGFAGTGGITIAANSTLSGNAVGFNGTLIVNSGVTFTTGNLLTLTSNSTSTGRIGNSAGSISGNVTVQRFIPAKATRRWSFVASPISQSLASSWQQQIHITGLGTGGTACPTLTAHSNGFDATLTNTPSMFSYNASNSSGSRWVANTTGTTSFNLTSGNGFRVLIRGPRTTGCSLLDGTNLIPTAVTLSATGTISNGINGGNITKAYNNTEANNWVLIGNPYPCELNFSSFRTTNSSVIGTSYVIYDPQNAPNNAVPANMYSTWNAGTWSNAPTSISNANGQFIANGQAFFVQTVGSGALIVSFNESHKYSGTQNGVFRTQNWNDIVRVSLSKDATTIDQTVIRFANKPEIQNDQLGDYDAILFNDDNNNIYLASNKAGKNMSIQTRSLSAVNDDEVGLSFDVANSGNYMLNFSEYENSSINNIYLVDKLTGFKHDVKQNSTYIFSVDKNNAHSYGSNRFSLVFKAINPSLTISNIKLFPNPATKQVTLQLPATQADETYTIRITDISGKIQLQQKVVAGVQHLSINSLAKGNYVVEVIDSKGNRAVEKLVKQ